MASAAPSHQRPSASEQQNTAPFQPQIPNAAQPASPPNKRDLKSWWKGFKLPSKHHETTGTSALSTQPHRLAFGFVEDFRAPPAISLTYYYSVPGVHRGTLPVVLPLPQVGTSPGAAALQQAPESHELDKPFHILTWPFRKHPDTVGFRARSRRKLTLAEETRTQGIFGVPLRQSITYANVAISLIDEDGKSYIYGYVPIVVAKCGVFLKERGAQHIIIRPRDGRVA